MPNNRTTSASGSSRRHGYFWVEAGVLLVFWFLMSGKFDPVHIGLGLTAVGIVMGLQHRLPIGPRDKADQSLMAHSFRFPLYLPWLAVQMIKATWQVAVIVVSPRINIDPCLVEFRSIQQHSVAHVTLGNSITLTPGTLTLQIDGDRYRVHALTSRNADDLLEGAIPSHVSRLFGGSGEGAVCEGRKFKHEEEA